MSGLGWLLLVETVVIVAATVGMFRLRKAADEQWRRYRMRMLIAPVAAAFTELKIQVVDRLTPALVEAAASLSRFADVLGGLALAVAGPPGPQGADLTASEVESVRGQDHDRDEGWEAEK